jgi:hypothetical protein
MQNQGSQNQWILPQLGLRDRTFIVRTVKVFFKGSDLLKKIWIQTDRDLDPLHVFGPITNVFLQKTKVKIEVCFPLWQFVQSFLRCAKFMLG